MATTVEVRATFTGLSGLPLRGQVRFIPRVVAVLDAAGNVIMRDHPLVVPLDGSGGFAVDLQATDDPTITPQDWTYKVVETVGGAVREYDIEVPISAAGPGIDLADISPAPVSAGDPTAFPTLAAFAGLQAEVDAIETGAAEAAQDAVGGMLLDTATINLTYDDATPSLSADVTDDSITNAKLAEVPTATVKGNATGGSANPADLTVPELKTLLGIGDWTDYVPDFAQTVAITTTVDHARWIQNEKTVIVSVKMAANSAGTAGGFIRVGLPVTPAFGNQIGTAVFVDASPATTYLLVPFTQGANVFFHHPLSGGSAFGNSPAVTIASGDDIYLDITYEAA